VPTVVFFHGAGDIALHWNLVLPKGNENWSSEQLIKHSNSLQKDLLKLSTNSKQIIAKKSGHNIHIDEPHIVVKAIKKLVKMKK